jgi:hypothetical protein
VTRTIKIVGYRDVPGGIEVVVRIAGADADWTDLPLLQEMLRTGYEAMEAREATEAVLPGRKRKRVTS